MFKYISGLLTLIGLLVNTMAFSQVVSISNNAVIESQYAISTSVNNTLTSNCAVVLSAEIPEDAIILSAQASYSVIAAGGGWMSEARSFIKVLNEGGGVTAVQQGTGTTAGTFNYDLDLMPIIEGASTDEPLEFQFNLFRTWGGSECNTTYQRVEPAALTISITYLTPGSCVVPFNLNLNNVGEDFASISFVSIGDNYQISYGEPGHTAGAGTLLTVQETSATITNLEGNTDYGLYIRSLCEPEASDWSEELLFSTLCGDFVGVIPPTYNQDFEDCVLWTIVNGNQPNKWVIGEATAAGGSKSIYVSNDNGINNNYTINQASTVYFYKDFEIATAHDLMYLSFDWKSGGEGTFTFFDYMRVFLMPTSVTPTPGVILAPNANTGIIALTPQLNLQQTWQTENIELPDNLSGQTVRIAFMWRNDASVGTQPAGAVDNISFEALPNPGKDLSMVSLNTPSVACINDAANIEVTVRNSGTEELNFAINTFEVEVLISGAASETLTLNVNEGTLASGELLTLSMPDFEVEAFGNYNFSATVTMVGDENTNNNGPVTAGPMTVSTVAETPSEVLFANYTGGNISNINPDWQSVINFTNVNNAAQQTALNQPTVRYNMWSANGNAVIQSPFVTVDDENIGAFWGSALTKWANGNPPDPMLVGDSVNVFIEVCGEPGQTLIWSANQNNQILTNQIQYFEYNLADYIGQTIRLRFQAKTTQSGGRDNDIHFGEFLIGVLPDCQRPTGLEALLVEPSEDEEPYCINLTWTPGSENQFIYEIYYGEVGFDPLTDGNLIQTFFDEEYTLCGIPEGASLEFYVRANCGAGGFSFFSFPTSISIPGPGEECGNPIVIEQLPYLNQGVNTAEFGNNHNSSQLTGTSCAGGSNPTTSYLNGDDVFFAYTPITDQTVVVRTFNIQNTWSSLYVMEGCPGESPNCLGAIGNSSTNDRVLEIPMQAGVTYNIAVSTWPSPQSVTFDIELFVDACPSPGSLVGSTDQLNQIEFTWFTGGGLEFELSYGDTGFNPEEGTIVDGILTGSYTVTNLGDNETLEAYVRAICEEGTSQWIGPATGATPCGAVGFPFFENFNANSNTVDCWNFNGNWGISAANILGFTTSESGAPYARFNWTPSVNNYTMALQSPIIDLTDASGEGEAYLSFALYLDNFNNNNENEITVQWKKTTETNWYTLQNFSNSDATGSQNLAYFTEHLTLFGALGNQIQLQFLATGENSFSINGWYLDDVSIDFSPVGINKLTEINNSLQLYPNPNNGSFNLVSANSVQNALLEVYDISGKRYFSKEVNLNTGEPEFVNSHGLAQGVYFIRLTNKTSVANIKMIVK
jgi:hypothetical protein